MQNTKQLTALVRKVDQNSSITTGTPARVYSGVAKVAVDVTKEKKIDAEMQSCAVSAARAGATQLSEQKLSGDAVPLRFKLISEC